jgi:hypothetical protein
VVKTNRTFIFSVLKKGLLRTIGCGENDRKLFSCTEKVGFQRPTAQLIGCGED